MPRDYFSKEMPDDFVKMKLDRVSFLFDGKDTPSETRRKDDTARRTQHSSKMHCSAFRWINFVSPCALSFEHTRAFGARADEVRLVEYFGSYKTEKAPVAEWNNYAKTHPARDVLKYWTLRDEWVSSKQAGIILEGIPDDDSSTTSSSSSRSSTSSKSSSSTSSNGSDSSADKLIANSDSWFDDRLKLVNLEASMNAAGLESKATVLFRENEEQTKIMNYLALDKSPQNSPESFLQQLELFERLHRLFETRDLSRSILSAYLFMTREYRMDLLHWMGSSLVPQGYERLQEDRDVFLRLHKMPPKTEGLGDKGFEKTERFFPYFNKIRTPRVLRPREVKQYHEDELLAKHNMCSARYVNEVTFARLVIMDGLRDNVPYENLCLVPYMLEWGHAEMNLGKPLRKPGSNSGLPVDYWD
jgi:hypothetical protein